MPRDGRAYIIPMVGGCGEFILVFTNYPKVTGFANYCSEKPEVKKMSTEFVSIAGFWPV
jgi:hypothetical protein